jgi:nucleotide-binding universal stress UspA family protein
VAAARQRYPEVRVEIRVVDGQAAEELVRASTGASLVVVGKSRRAALRAGSMSHTLVHHAHCPVLVDR